MTEALYVIETVNAILKTVAWSALYALFIAGLVKLTLMILKYKDEDDD